LREIGWFMMRGYQGFGCLPYNRVDEWVVWFKSPWGIRERLREQVVITRDFL
jgi:hypothetical protein